MYKICDLKFKNVNTLTLKDKNISVPKFNGKTSHHMISDKLIPLGFNYQLDSFSIVDIITNGEKGWRELRHNGKLLEYIKV